MRKINSFTFLTLNGFFKGPKEDISWHHHGGEEAKFSEEGANSDSILVFGRVTYDLMASFWPTPMAAEQFPMVAKGMNKSEKIVFSKTLKKAAWQNTTVFETDPAKEMSKLKSTAGKDITILGSGSIVTQLSEQGLIDTYQVMIDPVAIGKGTSLFSGMKTKLDLELSSHRIFKSGVVLLTYSPTKK